MLLGCTDCLAHAAVALRNTAAVVLLITLICVYVDYCVFARSMCMIALHKIHSCFFVSEVSGVLGEHGWTLSPSACGSQHTAPVVGHLLSVCEWSGWMLCHSVPSHC